MKGNYEYTDEQVCDFVSMKFYHLAEVIVNAERQFDQTAP
jgi:hypothetical protein